MTKVTKYMLSSHLVCSQNKCYDLYKLTYVKSKNNRKPELYRVQSTFIYPEYFYLCIQLYFRYPEILYPEKISKVPIVQNKQGLTVPAYTAVHFTYLVLIMYTLQIEKCIFDWSVTKYSNIITADSLRRIINKVLFQYFRPNVLNCWRPIEVLRPCMWL